VSSTPTIQEHTDEPSQRPLRIERCLDLHGDDGTALESLCAEVVEIRPLSPWIGCIVDRERAIPIGTARDRRRHGDTRRGWCRCTPTKLKKILPQSIRTSSGL